MHQTRYTSITSHGDATTNTRAAAALVACDVPLEKAKSLTSIVGDGIKGSLITWHLGEYSAKGESTKDLLRAWDSQEYAAANPNAPIVRIKAAFVRKGEIAKSIKEGTIKCFPANRPFIETNCTEMAASMEQLGHPIIGIAKKGDAYFFRFDQTAAPDFALWNLPDQELERRMPESLIAHLWCAFTNHRLMVDAIKATGNRMAAVKHRGRTAVIPANAHKNEINQLDQLLYRK
jgi:hypothetical protein